MADVNILARVEAAMASDTERQDKQSDLIAEIYEQATRDQREVLDQVFAALCGWSLTSILQGRDDNGEDDDDPDWEHAGE